MKKILKIFAVLILIAGGLLAAASIALHVLFPPEKAKALVLKQLSTHLKRQVTAGKVSIGLFSGFSVSDLKISEAPDFSKGTFVSSDRFSIHLALLPLLFRKIEVNELTLTHPKIHLVRMADGTFNFSDLLGPPSKTPSPLVGEGRDGGWVQLGSDPPAAPSPTRREGKWILIREAHAAPVPASPGGSAFQLVVARAQIEKGVIEFTDRSAAKQSVRVDPIDLKLKNLSLTSPFSVQASLKAKARGTTADINLAGDADVSEGSLKIQRCEVSSGGSVVAISGTASRLKSERPAVDLNLDIKDLKLASLAAFASIPPNVKINDPIRGKAHLKGDEQKLDFKLEAGLRSLALNSHGKIIALKSPQPQINMHLETNAFAVADILPLSSAPLPKDLLVQGKARFSADISGTQASSRVAAKFDATESRIVFGQNFSKPAGVPLRLAVVGELLEPTQTANFHTVTATLSSIVLNGNASAKTVGKTSRFQLAVKSNAFSLQDLAAVSPVLAPYKLNGRATLDLRASGAPEAPQSNGSVVLKDASAQYQRSTLSQLAAQVTFTQDDVAIPRLTGKLNGSDMTLKLTGRRLRTHPVINFEGTVVDLDLGKMLPAPPTQTSRTSGFCILACHAWAAPATPSAPVDLTGTLSVGRIRHDFYNAEKLEMKWDLKDVTPDLAKATGTAQLKQGPGVLRDIERLVSMSASAKVALMPIFSLQKLAKKGILKNWGLPDLDTIQFNLIHGDYVLRSGLMDIKKFDLSGNDLSVNTLGTIGLVGAQPLDVRMTLKLAPGAIRGTVGQLITDEAGRPTLAFTAKGTVSEPQVKLDTREAGKKLLNQLGQELFKGIQKSRPPESSQPLAEDAGPTTPESKPDPKKELEKALRNIFK